MHQSERQAVARGLLVRVVQRRREFVRDAQPDSKRNSLASGGPTQQLLHAVPVHVLHDQVVLVALGSEVDDVRDVRVIEHRRHPRFVEEHANKGRVLAQMGEDAFERDKFLEASLRDATRNVEFGHSAPSDPLHNLVATQPGTDRERRERKRGFGGRPHVRQRRTGRRA